jgi:hypothetical protein
VLARDESPSPERASAAMIASRGLNIEGPILDPLA